VSDVNSRAMTPNSESGHSPAFNFEAEMKDKLSHIPGHKADEEVQKGLLCFICAK
jgi:hypothetical protein